MLGLGLGLAALGVGIGLGLIGYGAMQGMARQPESIGKLQTAMLIALAFVELVFLLTVFVAPGAFRENVMTTKVEGAANPTP
ncbi:MAG TPA: ATP synthase F0 subunit C [Fimbriimonadaceae bacterium]|nr:ATP synthase F0 subunit C [Fimbriimonadaceae bacterium]